MEISEYTVQEAYDYVVHVLENHLSNKILFHSVNHMKEVLKYSEIIGKYMKLSKEELNIVKVCAIFHDCGYAYVYRGHEETGVDIATKFLAEQGVGNAPIQIVANAIFATKVPQNPVDVYGMILCDADLINLTYDNYFENAELMRQEWIMTGSAPMNELQFHKNSLNFFQNHHYHTPYGKTILTPKKQKVRKRLLARINELENM